MNNFRILKQGKSTFSFPFFAIFIIIISGLSSCVKNTPFRESFTVPSTYNFENTDSSAKAKLIMMKGMENYLATAKSIVLDTLLIDSLWQNKNNSFTNAMVPDFLYSAAILNNMSSISLNGSTDGGTSIQAFADSLYMASKSNSVLAVNGKAGYLQSGNEKYIVNSKGYEYKEIWSNAMIGAMALFNVTSKLLSISNINGVNATFDFLGLPRNYDPNTNYETSPLKADRPLGIASLFAVTDTGKAMSTKIYEELRRAGAAIKAGNSGIAGSSLELLRGYTDKAIVAALISYFDNVKNSSNTGTQLHNLSKAYGLVYAMQYRLVQGSITNQDYNDLREIMDTNFYTLIEESGFSKINQVRNAFANAYGL